eukprot:TRINITY_DN2668_c0_g3_i2.p1 TRINITY_DN2668_c0_g3~~TRINITY_DN2668_c0_g3_i2.p1  ORF type:complete len:1127 (-),score=362.14 TRINITY_DN2668_c0_g3_i2:197-3577(-)
MSRGEFCRQIACRFEVGEVEVDLCASRIVRLPMQADAPGCEVPLALRLAMAANDDLGESRLDPNRNAQHDAASARWVQALERAHATQAPTRFDEVVRLPDGSERILSTVVHPADNAPTTRAARAAYLTEDVTELRQREKELAEAKAELLLYKQMFEAAQLGMGVVRRSTNEPELGLDVCNTAFAKANPLGRTSTTTTTATDNARSTGAELVILTEAPVDEPEPESSVPDDATPSTPSDPASAPRSPLARIFPRSRSSLKSPTTAVSPLSASPSIEEYPTLSEGASPAPLSPSTSIGVVESSATARAAAIKLLPFAARTENLVDFTAEVLLSLRPVLDQLTPDNHDEFATEIEVDNAVGHAEFSVRIRRLGVHRFALWLEDITSRRSYQRSLRKSRNELAQSVKARTEAVSELEDALQVKNRFLAVMSHEIKTPLTGILGCLGLLSKVDVHPDVVDLVSIGQTCGRQLELIISDVLEYCKMDENKTMLEAEPFKVMHALEEAVEIVSLTAAKQHIEMICDVDMPFPDVVKGDGGRLRQILINLLGNACKFSQPQGQVLLTAAAREVEDSDEYELSFSVQDWGIGMPEASRELLFQPFTQADLSVTRKFGGSGLGLAICKKLAELMGGAISVVSKEGVGSIFSFTVRAEKATHEDACKLYASWGTRPSIELISAPLRVLLVDPCEHLLVALSKRMERMGWYVAQARTAAEAIHALEAHQVPLPTESAIGATTPVALRRSDTLSPDANTFEDGSSPVRSAVPPTGSDSASDDEEPQPAFDVVLIDTKLGHVLFNECLIMCPHSVVAQMGFERLVLLDGPFMRKPMRTGALPKAMVDWVRERRSRGTTLKRSSSSSRPAGSEAQRRSSAPIVTSSNSSREGILGALAQVSASLDIPLHHRRSSEPFGLMSSSLSSSEYSTSSSRYPPDLSSGQFSSTASTTSTIDSSDYRPQSPEVGVADGNGTPAPKDMRILLAEDSAMNIKLYTKMLKTLGNFDLTVVMNGRLAVNLVTLEKVVFDVILMDIMMPELGGWDATKEIRACRDCHQPRIVALTANTFEEDRQKSFSVGMDAFLTKPTTLGNLEKQLRHEAAVLGLPYGGGVAPAANGHVQATPAPPGSFCCFVIGHGSIV